MPAMPPLNEGLKRGLVFGTTAGAGGTAGYLLAEQAPSRRKKRSQKKQVSKAGALMPVVAAARGGFRRKAGKLALGAATGAGRGFRYARNNAMPLVVGGSIGAGGATAYQQTRSRRSEVGKSAKDTYLVARYGKSFVSQPGKTVQMLRARHDKLMDMSASANPKVAAKGRLLRRRMEAGMKRRAQQGWSDPRVNLNKSLPSALRGSRAILTGPRTADGYAASRVKANMAGRAAGRKKAAGDSVASTGLASVGRENRQMSRVASASGQRRRGMLSPRRAEALSLNSYRNPLSRV